MDDGPSLAAMDDALSAVEERLAPFLDAGVASLSESLPAAERARLSTTLAYAVASLTNVLLRVQGVGTADHPVREELERIKTYVQKVRAVTKAASGKAGGSSRGGSAGGRSRVDTAAAGRFVSAALGTEGDSAGGKGGAEAATGGGDGAQQRPAAPPEPPAADRADSAGAKRGGDRGARGSRRGAATRGRSSSRTGGSASGGGRGRRKKRRGGA